MTDPFSSILNCPDCQRQTIPIGTDTLPRRCPTCARHWQYVETQKALSGTESELLNEAELAFEFFRQGEDSKENSPNK